MTCGAMSCLLEVAVPEMAIDTLTYSAEKPINEGARVIVEVQTHLHTGFVIGLADEDTDREIKPLAAIMDDELMTDADIWDLAKWGGKVCMCGINTALRAILPKNFYTGEKVEAPPDVHTPGQFRETHNFNPFDTERVNFYVSELEKGERTLILFPTRDLAAEFYTHLHKDLKHESLLWPGLDPWESWQKVNSKRVRIVIGSPGAVFAPLCPERIIVEDEASPAYLIPYGLRVSARTLAGIRAKLLGSTFVLGGCVPSLKTYMRSHPQQDTKPDRKSIVLSDIYRSRKEEAQGIDGQIPLTYSLIRRTYTELLRGHDVIWFLNRSGESQEVYCGKCGHVVKCEHCGGVMKSLNDGNMLKCRVCGALRVLPDKCGECGHKFFRGKRPGIEALAKILRNYYPKVKLFVKDSDPSTMKGLILTTDRGFELLHAVKPSLVAWLDLDSELYGDDYDLRCQVFGKLCRSLYAGQDDSHPRKILVQARRAGLKVAEFLAQGWSRFLADELRAREEFMMPPFETMIELDGGGTIAREAVIAALEDVGMFVMDPGDETKPVRVMTDSLEEAAEIIAPHSHEFRITVRSE